MDHICIGNVKIERTAALAPMASVADRAYRAVCKEQGAAYMVSEMISAKGLCYSDRKTEELCTVIDSERPYALQLFGEDPKFVGRAASMLMKYKPDILDINMGCPVPKIVGSGSGSALMKTPEIAAEIVRAAVKNSDVPVTVKFRKGWDEEHVNALSFARMAEESGAAMITIHGRTREQMYSGTADRDIIAKIKAAVKIPVIGNGDIFTGQNALDMIKQTGCDGVMVARGAEGNPFIFREIKATLANIHYDAPSYAMRIAAAIDHAERLTKSRGDRAIVEMRKHVSWYLSGMHGSAALRGRVNSITSLDELKELLNEYLDTVKEKELH